MAFHRFGMLAVTVVALGIAAPAAAQFNPAFNHLKCYQIKDQTVVKTIVVDTQFGRERIVKLRPVLLCAPAKKTCCANPATVAGCQVVPCPADPVPATAVPHFKCYKIGFKECTDAAGTTVDCSQLTKFAKNVTKVNLLDQFGAETGVFVGGPKLLCAPVLKNETTTSTSTTQTTITHTTTTTTTTIPCHNAAQPGTPPVCAGDCPPGSGLACVFIPSLNDCRCEIPCAPNADGTCNMQFCPKATQQCCSNAVIPCACGGLPGTPCTAGSDCCSGNCMVPPGTCQ